MRFLSDLRVRHRRPEVMDQAGLDAGAHRQALDALRRVNRLSAGASAVWRLVRAFCRDRRRAGDSRPVRLLDIATGGGDLPIRLWTRARREGLDVEFAGCDRSALAVGYAADQARRARADVAFFEHDVLARPLPNGYDVLTASLFLHHLDEPEAVALLHALGAAGELVLIDDLRRSPAGWVLAYAGIRLLSRSAIAHVDGPRSVEGAFTCDEARALARQAGWGRFEVRPHWPCRFLLVGRRS